LTNLLDDIAAATALREGPEGVAQVLRRIYSAEIIELKRLSQQARIPVPVLAAVRSELERKGILERKAGGLALTATGRAFVEDSLRIQTRFDPKCGSCHGRRVVVGREFAAAIEKLTKHFEAWPPLNTQLDQAACLPETSIRRVLYMYESGALEGKSILILGDDDSISVTIGLVGEALGRKALARRVTVLETDPVIIDHLRRTALTEGLDVEFIEHDLRDPIPQRLERQFDTFETDPPYTIEGAALFLSRAVSALKPGVGRQGFLSFGAKSADETLAVQRKLQAMGLSIDEVIPAFNDYAGASILGRSSQMLRLAGTTSTAPLIVNHGPIYTGEAAPTVRLYRCLHCGAEINVGQGQPFATIEKLQAARCPACGETGFKYGGRIEITTALEIRPAAREDLAAVVDFEIDIARRSFPEDPVDSPEAQSKKLLHAFERSPHGMFVLVQRSEIVGWLWVSINTNAFTRQVYANLRSVAVRADRRRQGLAQAAVAHALKFAKANQAEWITTKVHNDNIAAKNLFAAAGFRPKHLTMELRF
jgi:predicted methyltransferase/ribosomal protein S18 acetylase RimI-like enzyme